MKDIDKLRENDDDRLIKEEGEALEEYMNSLYSDDSSEDLLDEFWRNVNDRSSGSK